MLKRLWLDDGGAVLTAELILLLVLLVMGIGVGLVMLRDAMVIELASVASAITNMNTSFDFGNLMWTSPDALGGEIKGVGMSSWDDTNTWGDSFDLQNGSLVQEVYGVDLETVVFER